MKKRELGLKINSSKLNSIELTSFYSSYKTEVFSLLLTPYLDLGSALVLSSYFKKNGIKTYLTPTSLAVYIAYDESNKDLSFSKLFSSILDFKMSQDELEEFKIKALFSIDKEDELYSKFISQAFGEIFDLDDEIKKVNLTSIIKEVNGFYSSDKVRAFYFGSDLENLKDKNLDVYLSKINKSKKERSDLKAEDLAIKKEQIVNKIDGEVSKVSLLSLLPSRESLYQKFDNDLFAYLTYLPYFTFGGLDKFVAGQEKTSNIISSSKVKIIEKKELILALNTFTCADASKLVSAFKKRNKIKANGFSFSKVKSIVYQNDAELAYDYIKSIYKWVEAKENNMELSELIDREINLSVTKFNLISKEFSTSKDAIYLQQGDSLK